MSNRKYQRYADRANPTLPKYAQVQLGNYQPNKTTVTTERDEAGGAQGT
jgi:hypothetical protein